MVCHGYGNRSAVLSAYDDSLGPAYAPSSSLPEIAISAPRYSTAEICSLKGIKKFWTGPHLCLVGQHGATVTAFGT